MTQTNRTSAVWYGALLRAQAAMPAADRDSLAAQLGFQRRPQPQNPRSHPLASPNQPKEPLPQADETGKGQRREYHIRVTKYQPQDQEAVQPVINDIATEPLEPIADVLQRGKEGQPLASQML